MLGLILRKHILPPRSHSLPFISFQTLISVSYWTLLRCPTGSWKSRSNRHPSSRHTSSLCTSWQLRLETWKHSRWFLTTLSLHQISIKYQVSPPIKYQIHHFSWICFKGKLQPDYLESFPWEPDQGPEWRGSTWSGTDSAHRLTTERNVAT